MKNCILIVLIFYSIFISCSRNKIINENLISAEEMINTDIVKAQQLLDSINPEIISDRFNQSYYFLLLAEADYKNNVLSLNNDSLLEISIQYYRKHDNKILEGRALLNKGRVWNKANMEEEALKYYLQALDVLGSTKEYSLLTKLYDDLGNIYLNQGLYKDALHMYKLWS